MKIYRCPCCGREIREEELEEVSSPGFGSLTPPKGVKMSSFIDGAECVHVAEISQRSWFAIIFLLFWLSGWTAGVCLMVNKFFIVGPIRFPEALFAIPFLLAEVLVLGIFLHMLFGCCRLEVGRSRIKYRIGIVGQIGWCRTIERAPGDRFIVRQSSVRTKNGRSVWNLMLKGTNADRKVLGMTDGDTVDYLANYFNRV